ncbi:MAG: riboflavin synthase [Pseudomonadota bacterium]|nr:riboflavin synthase [Pseudomonadota bacterium]MEE3295747.1 riboflavin synthase [Pseudomonadota bacterium]
MFSGIITDIGRILQRDDLEQTSIVVSCSYKLDDILIGGSISCSGVCLTITEKGIDSGKTYFTADISRETNERTTSKDWDVGTLLNLEPSLKIGDEIGGHFVYGHVDCAVKILSIEKGKNSNIFSISYPKDYVGLIVRKGSICLDGISLTINKVNDEYFTVNIIPQTTRLTTWSEIKANENVNLELDMLSRYVFSYLERERK